MLNSETHQVVFSQLKSILKEYESQLVVTADEPDIYSLDTNYSEKYKRSIYFGSVKINKRYVSFYLMPVYVFPDLLNDISPALRKRMQGKSCFNFSRSDETLFNELVDLTRHCFHRYKLEDYV